MALSRFAERFLSPTERFAEIMFAVIMVMTVVAYTRIAFGNGPEARQAVIVAAMGCNIAWGLVDGILYVLGGLFDRGRYSSLVSSIKSNPGDGEPLGAVQSELEGTIVGVLSDHDRDHIAREVLEGATNTTPEKVGITRADVLGALSVFALDFLVAFELVLPFLLFSDLGLATRISSLLAIGMLFLFGYAVARSSGLHKLRTGASMAGLGVVLAIITLALGG